MRRRLVSAGLVAVLTGAVLLAPSAAVAAFTPASGTQIKNGNSGKCLAVKDGSTAKNAAIVQVTCGGSASTADKLRVVWVTGDQYEIVANVSGRCLTVNGASTLNNAGILQASCSATLTSDLWRFQAVAGLPTYRITGVNSGKCLVISGASQADGATLVQFTCSSAPTGLTDQFYLPPTASPAATPIPAPAAQPIAAVQTRPGGARVGPIEYAFVDDAGRLELGHESDPDLPGQVTWGPAPTSARFAGTPQFGVHSTGQVQLSTHESGTGDLWLQNRTTDTPTYGPVQDVGGAFPGQPVVVRDSTVSSQRLVTFAIINGGLWHLPQAPGVTPYGAWRFIGGSGLVGTPTFADNSVGEQVFALNAAGAVQTATYDGGVLSDFTDLGGSGFTGTISAVDFPGPWVRLFVRAADGRIMTKKQNPDKTWVPGWTPVGDLTGVGSPSAILDSDPGRVGVVVRTADGHVHFAYETGQLTGTWGTTVVVPGTTTIDPALFNYNDSTGTHMSFVIRDGDNTPAVFTANPAATGTGTAKKKARGLSPTKPFIGHPIAKAKAKR